MAGDTFRFDGTFSTVEERMRGFNAAGRMRRFADSIGPRLAQRIKARAPRGKTATAGELADSTRYSRRTGAGWVRLEYTSDKPQAKWVTRGTKPHTIAPRTAQALYWNDGTSHFARLVHHPGTKANDYPRSALQDMRGEIASAFFTAFERP